MLSVFVLILPNTAPNIILDKSDVCGFSFLTDHSVMVWHSDNTRLYTNGLSGLLAVRI